MRRLVEWPRPDFVFTPGSSHTYAIPRAGSTSNKPSGCQRMMLLETQNVPEDHVKSPKSERTSGSTSTSTSFFRVHVWTCSPASPQCALPNSCSETCLARIPWQTPMEAGTGQNIGRAVGLERVVHSLFASRRNPSAMYRRQRQHPSINRSPAGVLAKYTTYLLSPCAHLFLSSVAQASCSVKS